MLICRKQKLKNSFMYKVRLDEKYKENKCRPYPGYSGNNV